MKIDYKRMLYGLCGAIFSSMLWEKFISPYFDSVIVLLGDIISYFSKGFSDSTYEFAAKIQMESYYNTGLYLSLFIIFSVIFVTSVFRSDKIDFGAILRIFFKDRIFRYYCIFSSLFMIIFSVYAMIRTDIAVRIRTNVINDIEEMSPYILEIEYRTLNSKFIRMRNKEDYQELMLYKESLSKKYKPQ